MNPCPQRMSFPSESHRKGWKDDIQKEEIVKTPNVFKGGGDFGVRRGSGQGLFFGNEVLSTFSRTIRFGKKGVDITLRIEK